MGMFCNYLSYSANLGDLISSLKSIVDENIIRPCAEVKPIYEDENPNNFSLVFDSFSASVIMLDEIDTKLRSQDYDMKINFSIYFGIFHTVPDWNNQIIKFIGYIMRNNDLDCAFETNGDVVMVRKNGEIIVDESRTRRSKKFPYEELNLRYTEGEIVIY